MMRKIKISLLFCLIFILMAAFPGKIIQADPLSSFDKSHSLITKKHPVPFTGRLHATVLDKTGTIPFVHVTVDGNGNVAHLGKVSVHLEEDIVFYGPDFGISDQDIVYIAANGDQLFVDATSNVTRRSEDPSILDIESTEGVITGGTGRFDGASGNYHLRAVVNEPTGDVQAWVSGSIIY